ncbi:hypothetical protein PSHT_01011 [Puccinia striiformis]|uniref:Bromodomain-containing protein n=2 Tax=Puccinia striiformis TaxID=27350 RepID=A0A2S4WLC0_9BASI|nr:hypothetical protein PSHT_01011 [Puccinia striiformis]
MATVIDHHDNIPPNDSAHPAQTKPPAPEPEPLPQSMDPSPFSLAADNSDGPESLKAASPRTDEVTGLTPAPPIAPPLPATEDNNLLPPPVSESPPPSTETDLNNTNQPTSNPPPPEPSDNPPLPDPSDNPPLPLPEPSDNPTSPPAPPAPADSTNTTEQVEPSSAVDPSSAVIPPTAPEENSTSLADFTPDVRLDDQSAAELTHPEDTLPAAASINSLSPLSDVPSAPSPPHALESQDEESSQLPLLPRTSPAPSKRQPSPSMYENGTSGDHRAEDSTQHTNGSIPELNGQSAHKRPRLASDASANPHMNSSLSHPLSDAPHSSNLPAHSSPSTSVPHPMSEPVGFVPGTPGTRFTKDQHRFAVSVTKQLKKHRSAVPFTAPVDPVALNIPDYFNVVKRPMDLSTIEARLGKAGKPSHYRSAEEFVADIQQVFTNCYLYNGPPAKSTYSRMALDLSIQFETQMKKMPSDEPVSHASTSRSPSLAKPAPKPKQSVDTRILPPALKRKNQSPTINALPANLAGTQKRRSTSPQHPRKKGTKATSISASALPDADPMNLTAARRASTNDHPPSQRHRPEPWDHSTNGAGSYGGTQYPAEPPMISNAKAELKFCKEILREVNKKAYSKFVWPFYEPVDVVKLGIPDYPKYVKKPMDLETMKTKLKENKYPNGAAFAEDFRLMLHNCIVFNPTGAYFESAKQLERLFEAKWTERPPEEIPAPTPLPVAPVTAAPQFDTLHQLQMQVAQLTERLNVVDPGHGVPTVPGTGPPKKHSISRAPAASKSSPSLNNLGSHVPPSAPSTSKGKTNPTGSGKPKQAHGGPRRKSAGSAPGPKRQTQSVDQQSLTGQFGQPELSHQPYQQPTPAGYPLPPALPSAGIKQPPRADYFEAINYEQKKDLAIQIQNAVEPMQSDAINLIRNSRPDLVAADGEEIELDIDALDDRTLYQLYQLVCAPVLPPPKPKKPKATAANGKTRGVRKAGPGAPRKSMPTPVSSFAAPVSEPLGGPHGELPVANPYPTAPVANGHENGGKPKVKKPRASAPGPPKRKGIDETAQAALIKDLQDKLDVFEAVTEPQQQPLHQSNGVSSTNLPPGPPPSAPPAGPVEYASSSSESESDSDDDSD